MKTYSQFRYLYTALIVIAGLIFGVQATVFAQEESTDGCTGDLNIQLSNIPKTTTITQPNTLWFYGEITIDRQLASCINSIEIVPKRSWSHVLRGPTGDVESTVLNGQRKSISRNTAGNFLLPTKGQGSLHFWIKMPKGKLLTPGTYSGDFAFRTISNQAPTREKYASINYTVMPFVRARIEARNNPWVSVSGASISVNMGNLTIKNRRKLTLVVLSNTSVKLEIDSENNQKLVNQLRPDFSVPYYVKVDGRNANHNSPMFLNTRQNKQTKVQLAFENKAIPGAKAGRYEDEMTISLIAY